MFFLNTVYIAVKVSFKRGKHYSLPWHDISYSTTFLGIRVDASPGRKSSVGHAGHHLTVVSFDIDCCGRHKIGDFDCICWYEMTDEMCKLCILLSFW